MNFRNTSYVAQETQYFLQKIIEWKKGRLRGHLTFKALLIIKTRPTQYSDVIMGVMAFQSTRFTIVYPTVYSDADQLRVTGLWVKNSPATGEFPA